MLKESAPHGINDGLMAVFFLLVGPEIKRGIASLPRHASCTQQWYGVALLCGIGFTMSLFIGALAFTDPATADAAKIGVLTGSLASAGGVRAAARRARRNSIEGAAALK